MIVRDFSPPSSPSIAQQQDALQKGLGRAHQWAIDGKLEDGPLLEACLQDLRYDSQIDGPRAHWLWTMVRASGAADRFRAPILQAFNGMPDERDLHQLCAIAAHYALTGDESFRRRLYEIVEQRPYLDRSWLGEEEIMQLDGEAAFAFAARVRGQRLIEGDSEWDHDGLVREAVDQFGKEPVDNLLANNTDEAIRAFAQAWLTQKADTLKRPSGPSYEERMRTISVESVLEMSESGNPSYRLRRWGRLADDSQREVVLRHLRTVQEPTTLANLLWVFSDRAVPQGIDTFLALSLHDEPEVSRRALGALENIAHPSVRQLALDNLGTGIGGGSVVGLLARNFQPGDEGRILEALEIPEESSTRHDLMMDVIKILQTNAQADAAQLGVVAYATTPCGHCREKSVRLLLDRHVAPGWLLDECRNDSNENIRALVNTNDRPNPGEPA